VDLKACFAATWRAREKLLDACERLPRSAWRRKLPYSWRTLHAAFAHLIETERSWMMIDILGRAHTDGFAGDGGRRHYGTPARARARGRAVAAVTRRVLRLYGPLRLEEKRRVPRFGRKGFQIVTVDQILTHVYTHELRHQGQIQSAIRRLGRTPPNVDWI
jgi:uncharacterized damage-inducible protein DinB